MTKLLINFRKHRYRTANAMLFSNFSTNGYKATFSFVCVLWLSGCSDWFAPTAGEICESHPAMCVDLNLDGRCRRDRADIIHLRYTHREDEGDAYKYPLMLALEKYAVCVEEAQHIEHVKRKGKEASRLKGVITARRELQRLARETKDSLDPYLTYYHWTRFNDQDAFHRFERYAASHKVSAPDLLVSLASFQIKSDENKTIQTLYRALSLYKNSDNIDNAIFHSLYQLGLTKENFRFAYVWLTVATYFDDNVDTQLASQLANKHKLPVAILNDVAEQIADALDEGEFSARELKLNKL
ncbi:DUF2989 domain-containing protein [Alteromonas sp. 345S023]|uniref:DUF2989 domain-containing protein n=1 Tax=Alteromonas profundi TaxID=2696062 RepID=A0A7X5LJT1_9ALTE|nr:DUF2989 domain-containing protein [Alteromonas profundi]NDV90613.1 DUF2989 domain-containing protein [Alteromonas profundi]